MDEYEREGQTEQDRGARAVDHARQHVAVDLVGAEPIHLDVAAAAVRPVGRLGERGAGGLAIFFPEGPGRSSRRRRRRGVVHRAIREANRRPQHPAVCVDLVGGLLQPVVGIGHEAPELLIRIILEDRDQQLAFVRGEDRPVVRDEFGGERDHEDDEEQAERPEPALVVAEDRETTAIDRRQPAVRRDRRAGSDLRDVELVADGRRVRHRGARNRCADRPRCRLGRRSGSGRGRRARRCRCWRRRSGNLGR